MFYKFQCFSWYNIFKWPRYIYQYPFNKYTSDHVDMNYFRVLASDLDATGKRVAGFAVASRI